MVGKKKRRHSSELLGSHQRCWLWGRHAVLETLRAARWVPLEVHIDPTTVNDGDLVDVQRMCDALQCELIDSTPAARMTQLCRSSEHQGLLAKMPPFPYWTEAEVLRELTASAERTAPFVVLLDGIQDPHNFGSILRSADIFGAQAVFVPAKGQAEVSVHVVRSSAGGINFLKLVRCESLLEVSRQLKHMGITVWGASEKGMLAPAECHLLGPSALAIGNEGTGLSAGLLAECDQLVAIPQWGHVGSLNAAVAAGILFYEVQRQRRAAVR